MKPVTLEAQPAGNEQTTSKSLFEPLGINNPTWAASPDGVSLGGFGLSVTTEDIARFGQMYLQKGVWQGQAILSPEWVALATARQVSNGSNPQSGTSPHWSAGPGRRRAR